MLEDFFAFLDSLDIVCNGGRSIVVFGGVGAGVAFAGDLADEIAENCVNIQSIDFDFLQSFIVPVGFKIGIHSRSVFVFLVLLFVADDGFFGSAFLNKEKNRVGIGGVYNF